MSLEAKSRGWTSEFVEGCEDCERETRQRVRIELRSENPESGFSREPYRVAECRVCGGTEEVRMNNA